MRRIALEGSITYIAALAAALIVMLSPGSALAVKYWTNTGTVTATANGNAINVSATYTTGGTSCGNGGDTAPTFFVEWDVTPADWTGAGYGSSGGYNADTGGVSPYAYTTPNLAAGTYAVRVTYEDANGIASCGGGNVAVNAGSNVTLVANNLTVGTNSAVVNSSTQITASATFSDDINGNSNTSFRYSTNAGGPWTDKCLSVTGNSPRTCVIDGLSASTDYYVQVTHSDADGVTGTNPQVVGPYTTQSAVACDPLVNDCSDCHAAPPADWDGISPKAGTTGHKGDHAVPAHTSDGARDKCAICHFKYSGMVNVTSAARWPVGHLNGILDIYTSNHVANKVFSAPYDKGIKGGYYKGYRNRSTIFEEKAANANNACTATYCHGAGDSPVWGTGTASCGSCHSLPPSAGKHATHSQGLVGHGNGNSGTTYDFGCYKCHSNTSGHSAGPVSANRAALVDFNNLSSPVNASGSYVEGALAGTDGTFKWTNGTCNGLYCHSTGKGGAPGTTATWNGTMAANCAGCHRGTTASGTPMNSGKHTQHMTSGAYNYACNKCHNDTTTTGTTVTNTAFHVNSSIDVKFEGQNPTGSYAGTTCSSMSCHSDGAGGTGSADWTGAAMTCTSCHKFNKAAAPNDITSGKHTQHINNGDLGKISCSQCHRLTVSAGDSPVTGYSRHVNAAKDVYFNAFNSYTGFYTGTYTCRNNYCHSSGQATPAFRTADAWNGATTYTCNACHGADNYYTDVNGSPDYQNVSSSTRNSFNGHYLPGHVAATGDCIDCHRTVVNNFGNLTTGTVKHIDASRDVMFKGGGTYSNKRCTNTNCHGTSTVRWGGTLPKDCQSCHSDQGAGSYANHSTTGKHKKHTDSATYNYACEVCHALLNASGNTDHAKGDVGANQAAQIVFHSATTAWRTKTYGSGGAAKRYVQMDSALGAAHSPVYAAGPASAGSDPVNVNRKWTQGRCTAIWCHSNGQSTPTYVNFANWSTAETVNCRSCHAGDKTASPTINSGKHTQHVNNAELGSFRCALCHVKTVATNTVIDGYAKHVDGTRNVNFTTITVSNYTGFYTGTYTCRNNYCHSSGQATPAFRTAAAWNSATVYGCDDCHGSEGTTYVAGAPEYANTSTSNRNSFNGHYVSGHVSAVGDCIDCHRTVVNNFGNLTTGTVKHINGTIDIVFKGGGSYANKRCSGTASSCHGATTPRWGGSLACADCHQVTAAETDNFSYGDATKATVNFYEYTSVGHGKKGTYRYTANAGANLSCTSTSDTNTVGGCHRGVTAHNVTGNPFRLVSSATIKPTVPNSLCATTCHTSPAVQNHVKAITGGTKYATWFFTPKCVDCHDPHGDNGGNDTAQRNYMMVQSFVNYSTGSNAYGAPYPAATYPRRAMDFPAETTRPASLTRSSFVTAGYDGICQLCHRRNSTVVFDRNQNQAHNGTTVCTDCHTSSLVHNEGFKGAGGSCLDCHNQVQNSRPSMQAEFGKTSHHVSASWASFTTTTCSVCHLEGDSTGAITSYHNNNVGGGYPVDLRVIVTVGATEATTVTNNANSVQFYSGHGTNGGTRSAGNAANRHCGGCHNETNAASKPFPTAEATDLTPGAYTPTNAGSVFKRYSSATTTKSHPYNPNTYNVVGQLNKAYSPHGHPEKNQMKNVVSGAWVDDTQTVSNAVGCLDCHNSHGSNAGADETGLNMITYNSAVGGYFGGLIKEESAYDPDKSGTTFNAVSDLCFDCHLGDDASAPKKYSDFGVAAARPVKEYFDAGRWTPNFSNVSSSFAYKAGTLAANSGRIKGGHFGASEALRGSATNSVGGSCLACHDPHGTPYTNLVGPGSERVFMAPALKGTWMASPYKEDRVGEYGASTLGDANPYSYSMNKSGRVGPRESPAFAYNNPAKVGAGFGTGASAFGTYAAGGSGHDGYFVDDNTFGNSGIGSTASNPWASAITGTYISQTDSQFAGLCLGCHPQTNIDAEVARTAGETGNVAINVHRTVKGWDTIATASDFFKPAHTNQHLMAYKATGTDTTNWCGTTHAYYPVPSGYRWSVNPGTQITIAAGRPPSPSQPMVDPPSGGGGQQGTTPQSTYHQFPCAKCHAPHATKLPRLMKTNCLDVGPTESSGTHKPKHNSSFNMGYCDDGSGVAIYKRSMVCHNSNRTNTSGGGGWNIKTGW
ncbi:MAG: CxxxxCH/CxxCH domain-containing protein [Nitrospirae bacterium]|nr:CxxxxCH/CxxCH domain-containing protein [Nitrospirota bacterium]